MLLRSITRNLSFADAQFLAKFLDKQYDHPLLRHMMSKQAANPDFKGLRAGEIQGKQFRL
jgi:hypothetical protein